MFMGCRKAERGAFYENAECKMQNAEWKMKRLRKPRRAHLTFVEPLFRCEILDKAGMRPA